jgi:putative membrane protein
MNIKLMAIGLAPILALGACGGDKNTTNLTTMESPVPMDNLAMDNAMMTGEAASPGQAFANTAGASDWYEVEAGKLAQEKATSQALKDFGAMMEKAHTDTTEKLKAAAAKANPAITPNPALNAEQEANLATLRDATGADFDTAYKAQQVAAHEKALAAMKDYAANGDVPELKAFASETSKAVQMHLDKIKGM